MKAALVAAALVASVMAMPQSVSERRASKGYAPEGCSASYSGNFQITAVGQDELNKRTIAEIQARSTCGNNLYLEMTLTDGVLVDAHNRTGYIASNYQFQFDAPPQADALSTSGFSACENSSLALGSSATWYQCLSGDFYNLYDRDWAEQCEPVSLVVLACDGTDDATAKIAVDSDSELPVCQIGDGQIQVHTTSCYEPTATATTPVIPTGTGGASTTGNTTVVTPTPASSNTSGTTPTATQVVSNAGRLGSSVGALFVGMIAASLLL